MTSNELKLFVWENVLTEYTSGLVCILAHSFEEAREIADRDFESYEVENFFGKPYQVYEEPHGFLVWGGG